MAFLPYAPSLLRSPDALQKLSSLSPLHLASQSRKRPRDENIMEFRVGGEATVKLAEVRTDGRRKGKELRNQGMKGCIPS